MNDHLVTYVEKDIFEGIINDIILSWFQKMRYQRVHELDGS
jgi:hypothetical protein